MTTDPAWIDAALTSARPQAVSALLRYFRDLDLAEEAFQDACLRALKSWPEKGPPRDPAAWLILVGRNSGIDGVRRRSRLQALPSEEVLSDLDDVEAPLAERLDGSDYRDDILRLLFICCHPDLPAVQQVAVALRIVSGLSVRQIARSFLVSEAAMEQRITRAKAKIGQANVAFEAPGPAERAERLAAVAAVVYLIFNEGYAATAGQDWVRPPLCEEALRLGRILAARAPQEPEVHGLVALMELQASRLRARAGPNGEPILLLDQNRARWDRLLIGRGLAALERAQRLAGALPGPYLLQAALAACHARARTAAETDWGRIVALYGVLGRVAPSPIVELNRAVAVGMEEGPAAGLELVEALAAEPALKRYHLLPSVRGDLLAKLGRHREAAEAFEQAVALTRNVKERVLMEERAATARAAAGSLPA